MAELEPIGVPARLEPARRRGWNPPAGEVEATCLNGTGEWSIW
jgi:hypothetical protein